MRLRSPRRPQVARSMRRPRTASMHLSRIASGIRRACHGCATRRHVGGTVAWGEMWGNIELRVPYPSMTLHIPYPEQEGMFTCHTHTVDGHQARMAPQRNHGLPVCVYGPCSGRVWHSWPVSISVVPPLPLSPPPHDRLPPRPHDRVRALSRERSNARPNP